MPDSAGPIHVTLRCFAAVRDILDTDTVTVEVEAGTTARGMLEKLGQQYPALLRVPVAFAVNRDYARADSVLSDGDEVAFIPPISGGSGAQDLYRFDLTEGELDPRALEQECRTDRDGAVVTFAGTTRDHNDGAQVISLSYEAYTEMAQRVMCVLSVFSIFMIMIFNIGIMITH